MRARYERWDGTQDPLGEFLDVGDVLERLGDDLLMGAGGDRALRGLLDRGIDGQVAGLDELRRRLAEARRRLQERIDPDGPLADLRERLDDIVATERGQLAVEDDPDARFAELRLDALPASPSGAIRELQEYGFRSPDAALRFQELLEDLRGQVLDSYFRNLTAGMQAVTPDDVAEVAAMMADLNAMLQQRDRGDEPDFDAFMAEHGHLFPEQPEDLDELLEVLARRMVAMSQMLASMTPEQRRELQELARSLLDDLDLAFQMSQLDQQLRQLMPQLRWDQPQDPYGFEPAPLSSTVDAFERLAEVDELEEQLASDRPGADLDDIDEDLLRDVLGDEAVVDLQRLRRIERELEQRGLLARREGELELTPRGARMLGERALTQLLDRVRRQRAVRATGPEAEATGQTRPWSFGDREPLAVQASVRNAVVRSGPGTPLRLAPEDLEVVETEVRPRTATALLLDLSFSMPLRGHFVHAKRMALALHALIEGRYPQDALYLIGFSDYARRIQPAELGAAGFERVYGTNMHHAFMLARRVLSDDPRPVKQVIMVTDGEPTAHLEGEHVSFNWPPVRETIVRTLREATRLSRSGISINVFLLEEEPGLVDFADRLAALTGGQVFQSRSDQVGRFVLRDYVRGRP
ncbi:MAG: hypothetical protein KY437_00935 [Actinobacteria bacterium]|nr:hypothetical protein [Actinomycetota bacterium]